MTQLLIGGVDPAKRHRDQRSQAQTVTDAVERTEIAFAFSALCEIADEAAPLRAQLAALAAKLADPALADHPRRPAAEEKRAAMEGLLAELEGRAHARMADVAERWERVSPDGRPADHPAANGVGYALALWREAVESVGERAREREAYRELLRPRDGRVPF